MAMYEFQCHGCGTRFERLSWTAEAADPRCACGSAQVERIWFSRVAVGHAAGSGEAAFSDGGEAAFSGCGESAGGCCGGGMCGMGEGEIQ